MTPVCSLVIRAYNEEAHLPRLLEGIRAQTLQPAEVILVDSGSQDATVSVASAFGATVVHISPGEFTFGRSLNLGIKSTTSEFIAIASAHVYPVYPDWLEQLLAPFANPRIALTYGKQRGTVASRFSEHQIFSQWFPEHSDLDQQQPFCNNANAAIRRSLWEQHPYDESLTGLEDVAWAAWALHEGYNLAYVAEAEIAHFHDEKPQRVFNRYRREAMAFKRLYPEAHFSLYDLMRMAGGNIWSDSWHAARERVLLRNLVTILWFRSMQFWGTYQGYRHPGPVTARLRETFYYPRERMRSEHAGREVEPIRYNGPASK
jgi:glycosyltransferase involved in cell wall biosynthesis